MGFTFGSDPELMLFKDGRYYSAIGIIPGTKDKRFKRDGNSFYYDNVLAECTIKPSKSKDEAIANIGQAIKSFAGLAAPYKLIAQASQKYPKDQLLHEDALAIGCKPEYCAYALKAIKPPEDKVQTSPLRSGGGHVHIGSSFAKDTFGCLHTIRMLDLFLGLPAVYMDHDKTTKKRKELYGQAGRFRQPPHGAEYRSMGNFWLSSPKLVGIVFDLSAFTMNFLKEGRHNDLWNIDQERLDSDDAWNEDDFDPAECHKCIGYNLPQLRAAIDNMDRKKGNALLQFVFEQLPKDLVERVQTEIVRDEPYDLYKEWEIK